MSMFLVKVIDTQGLANRMAAILGASDRAESWALGTLETLEDNIQYGLENTNCFMLVSDTKGIICLGGYETLEGSLWLLTSEAAEGLNRKEKVQAVLKLRGFLNKLLDSYPTTIFRNQVSISNYSHIKLIKALGGKGFNTMTYNPKNDAKFYPFHFCKE